MSIRLMTLVWDVRWPTQNHLLVMLKLADHANDEGSKVWPAVATIAKQAQCSERTVQNVLKALRDCGLISAVKAGGGSMPTIYELNVNLLRGLASLGAELEGGADVIEIPEEVYAQALEMTGATVAPLAVAPVQPATERGATEGGRGAKLLHPNHHLEPSREPPHARSENFINESEVPPRLVLRTDPAWRMWHDWVFKQFGPAHADAFTREGAMVVFSAAPSSTAKPPKLPPRDLDKYDALMQGRQITTRSKAMQGEAVE